MVTIPISLGFEDHPGLFIAHVDTQQLAAGSINFCACCRVPAVLRLKLSLLFEDVQGELQQIQACLDSCTIFTSSSTCPVSRPRPRGICTCWKRMPVGLIIINNNNNQPFWLGDMAEADWFYCRKKELCVSAGSPHRSLTRVLSAHVCNQLHVTSSLYPSLPSCSRMIHSTSTWVPTVFQARGRVPEKNIEQKQSWALTSWSLWVVGKINIKQIRVPLESV